MAGRGDRHNWVCGADFVAVTEASDAGSVMDISGWITIIAGLVTIIIIVANQQQK